MVAFSGGLAALMAPHWAEERLSDRIGMAVVLGAFGLVGLLLLYTAAHQALASFTAETIVEVEHREVGPGETVRVRILQPGPVSLRSLNATLVRKQSEALGEGGRRRATSSTAASSRSATSASRGARSSTARPS